MNATAPVATSFKDDISLRARNVRFRGIGNPYAFLDEIGLVPITEFLYRGANIIDVAEALNLPISTIHTWVANNNYGPEFEEASVLSAEGYIARGEKMLLEAQDKFQLDKAKAMLEHGRFMASKKNKKVYGNTADVGSGQAAVNYIFNIGEAPKQLQSLTNAQQDVLEAEFHVADKDAPITLDLADNFMEGLGQIPAHIPQPRPPVATPSQQARNKAREVVEEATRVEVPRGVDRW